MRNKFFPILLAICLCSCGKNYLKPTLPAVTFPQTTSDAAVVNFPVNIKVDENKRGYNIPENFEGLSFETGLLAENPDFLNENNKVVIRLIKNLGQGILRVGGNTSDLYEWTNNFRTEKTPENSITKTEVDNLSAFSAAIGWPVIFGLNLGKYNPGKAAHEALYVNKSLKENLYAFQSGNEPDEFYTGPRSSKYNFNSYQKEWCNYLSAVRKEVPKAQFAGPDITPFNSAWVTSFAKQDNKNISLIDGHYYNSGPASTPSIGYKDILTQNDKLAAYLGSFNNTSSEYHLPFRVSECNSVFGGGKKGVSDVFASALWALDFMWEVAENKGQGVNFHGGVSSFYYSPITIENGLYAARPVYYAMLAFRYAAAGQTIVPVNSNVEGYNFSVHAAVDSKNKYFITLINKEVEKNFSFTIELNESAASAKVIRLASPGITAANGVTFAGSTVNADGSFVPNITEHYIVSHKRLTVTVPAGSAAIVMVQ